MATFIEDLDRALNYGMFISRERAQAWRTNAGSLLEWQAQSFSNITDDGDSSGVNAAWLSLLENGETRQAAILLHVELRAIVDFQGPLVDLPFNPYEIISPEEPDPPRETRPLRKAMGLLKSFLESLKEIFGDLLGAKGKAALQIAIEAAEAFS